MSRMRRRRSPRTRRSDYYSDDDEELEDDIDSAEDDIQYDDDGDAEDERARHERMARIYDQFKEYVHDKVRARSGNASLDVVDFSAMEEPLPTHMALRLENVTRGCEELYKAVAAFRDETTLECEDNYQGQKVYTAYIPHVALGSQQRARPRKRVPARRGAPAMRSAQPSPYALLVWVIVFMALLLSAVAFTRVDEWRALAFWRP